MFIEEPPMKLKTLKPLEESIIEEEDVGREKETDLQDDETEVNESTPEKHEIEKESMSKGEFVDDDSGLIIKNEDIDNLQNPHAEIKPAVFSM